jgi:type II secretory pathway pseudopilin PulG
MRLLRSPQTARRRTGFTLVELLVATALTMLIMAVISSAFQTAMDSLSHLRSAGELQDRLRSAGEKIRQDLQAPHFEDEAVKAGKLSEVRNDTNPGFRPQAGFFHIEQASESVAEHAGSPLSPRDFSTIATNHGLMFTVQLPGTSRQTVFTAPRIGCSSGHQCLDEKHDNLVANAVTTYASRWAIVSWFLVPTTDKTAGPVPANNKTLYNLHRRVKLLAEVPDTFITPGAAGSENYFYDATPYIRVRNPATGTYGAAFANPNYGRVYTAKDRAVTDANARFDRSVIGSTNASVPVGSSFSVHQRPTNMFTPVGDGSDIVMSNILSFEVKADYSNVVTSLTKTAGGTITTLYPRPSVRTADLLTPAYALLGVTADQYNASNKDFPFDDLPLIPGRQQANPRTFDTGAGGGTDPLTITLTPTSTAPAPQATRIKALQIKLRIYDPKNKTTRQQTIVQEM